MSQLSKEDVAFVKQARVKEMAKKIVAMTKTSSIEKTAEFNLVRAFIKHAASQGCDKARISAEMIKTAIDLTSIGELLKAHPEVANYLGSSLAGAGIGAATGALTGEKGKRGKRALIGAGLGAGAGAGAFGAMRGLGAGGAALRDYLVKNRPEGGLTGIKALAARGGGELSRLQEVDPAKALGSHLANRELKAAANELIARHQAEQAKSLAGDPVAARAALKERAADRIHGKGGRTAQEEWTEAAKGAQG